MCKTVWIGVDLGSKSFFAAIADGQTPPSAWASLPVKEFANTPTARTQFVAWVKGTLTADQRIAGVCLEATGGLAWDFARGIAQRLGALSIVNPARPVAFARSLGLRDKTDRIDACVLALYGVALRPAPRPLPTSLQRQLRELSALYERGKKDVRACENQLRETIKSPVVRRCLRARLRALEKEMALVATEMDRLIDSDATLKEDARRMSTIPGIAEKTRRVLLAHFGDLREYSRNELVALAGLYPKRFQSGTSVHKKPTLAKGGGARIRAALYMAALTSRKHCPQLKRFADRLEKNGMTKMAILGAVMRKLLLLARAVVVSGNDYQADYGQNAILPDGLSGG